MKQRKIPMRMCIGCREMKPKRELTRVVRSPQGQIGIDPTGKMQGRGFYVCSDPACLARIQKTKALERAVGMKIPQEIFQILMQETDQLES